MPEAPAAIAPLTRPLFLLGMMGAGKSRVGRELADASGSTFIDLDDRVERMFGASVSDLFELGEDYFRACERTALVSLVAEPGFAGSAVVVATGGGVVVNPANLDTMASIGELVYLHVGVEILCARLSTARERSKRPLLGEGGALAQRLQVLIDARESSYRAAGTIVEAEGSPGALASEILGRVGSK